MKYNVQIGDRVTVKHVVKASDFAAFQGKVVHQVCSTYTLAREIEWSSRQFVLKMREDDEEGVGTMLTINHQSPAFVDEELEITATVASITENELICTYEVKVKDRLVASGKTGQKVLKRSKLAQIFS